MGYFPEPFTSKSKIEVESDLSNYATKFDPKNTTDVDTSKFSKTDDLAGLKSGVDKSNKMPNGLNFLKSNIDKLDVDKLKPVSTGFKTLSDVVKNEELVIKVNVNDTNELVKKQTIMIKIMRLKVKYLKEQTMTQKKDVADKYFITSDYNKFTNVIINTKIKEKELVNKSDPSRFINNSDLDKKIKPH